MEQAPKTVGQMIVNMNDSIKFIRSRIGWTDNNLFQEEQSKKIKSTLAEVEEFLNSEDGKDYFTQWYNNAEIFEGLFKKLKFAAEESEKHNVISQSEPNEGLQKVQDILEDLEQRIEAAMSNV
jgi:flagellin-specific chaperone FliS